jgi:hypothetical protein
MLRAPLVARRFPASPPPPPPQHVGAPLQVGQTVLLRRPNEWLDFKVELRGIEGYTAVVFAEDRFEIVRLDWLRRPLTHR